MIEEYNNQIYCFFIKRLPDIWVWFIKNKNGAKTCFTVKASVWSAEENEKQLFYGMRAATGFEWRLFAGRGNLVFIWCLRHAAELENIF